MAFGCKVPIEWEVQRQLMFGLYTWWMVEPLLPPTAVPPPGR
jgi:hypothetical protein